MARPPKAKSPALAYLRTSSSANVGADKDSDKRQRRAIATFAKHAGYELLEVFYDADRRSTWLQNHCLSAS
jgi:DNA invertase Pin-like site-specific DNA recombinase